jgi:hypothetical protein
MKEKKREHRSIAKYRKLRQKRIDNGNEIRKMKDGIEIIIREVRL